MEDKTDKQQQFIELRAKGNSFDNIAKKLNVSKGTLINWSKNFDLEIKNQTSVEMDSLRDKLALTKKHQLESYGEQLSNIRNELSKRDLSDIKTEKLIEVEIKLLEAVNALHTEPEFAVEELWSTDRELFSWKV